MHHVLVVSGSGNEATAFATETKQYLDSIGAETKGVDVGVFGNPEVNEGTHVFKEGDGINIILGRAPLK